jgi:HD-GYP domain-containing protein (c-di-GMP phosphodiesterase class II)
LPADHAKALAVILREEFDEPFLFQDVKTGAVVHGEEGRPQDGLEPAQVAKLAAGGRACVTPLASGGYQVALPLYGSGQTILVATATLPPLSRPGSDARKEQRRLEKWAQSVCERLRSSDYILSQSRGGQEESTQAKTAWEVILALDHLLRRLRIHKNTAASQQRVLQTAFELLGVETLIWVPCDPDAHPLILGQTCLAAADCRQLAQLLAKDPDFRTSGPLLCNEVASLSWGGRFPQVANLMAFVARDQRPVGWVLALNKKAAKGAAAVPGAVASFRRSDAALLTPFVALLELQVRTADRYQDLKNLLVGLTRSLTAALDAKDTYTYGHSERVARIAVELAGELGLSEDEIGNVYLAGLLHDIGKIGVSDAVLSKADRLTAEEYEHVKKHVTIGYSILADLHQIRDLLPGVLYHHEQYDGSGYPDGLAAEAIPLLARILAVADAYDAMSTTRPYRAAMPCERVEEILTQGADKQWDRRVIEAFLRCRQNIHAIRERGVGESLRQALDGALHMSGSASVAVSHTPVKMTW